MRTASEPIRTPAEPRGVNILARSLFRQMREQGYSAEQIVGLSSELIHLVSAGMKDDLEPAE
jgi:hypothetical protein